MKNEPPASAFRETAPPPAPLFGGWRKVVARIYYSALTFICYFGVYWQLATGEVRVRRSETIRTPDSSPIGYWFGVGVLFCAGSYFLYRVLRPKQAKVYRVM